MPFVTQHLAIIDMTLGYLLIVAQSLALLFIFYASLFTGLNAVRRSGIDKWPVIKGLIKVLVVVFIIADWWVNVLITLLFLDLPSHYRELVTGRMKRYKQAYPPSIHWRLSRIQRFRVRFAKWICKHLNQYNKGHC